MENKRLPENPFYPAILGAKWVDLARLWRYDDTVRADAFWWILRTGLHPPSWGNG
jgi:hypothetical protein